jgi:uncharacterized protein (TIGR02646 family)
MRTITKGALPQALIRWRADNAAVPQNLVYGAAAFPSEAVRKSLLAEQFHLCAYTMRQLKTAAQCQALGQDTRASCHIEHLWPQCRNVPSEDIDYQNMVACFPPSQSKAVCEFGAHAKADFDPDTGGFVSPLSPNVHAHFKFDQRGRALGSTADGDSTIQVLNLNHPILVNDRAAAIKGALQPKGKPLSAQAARRLAQQVLRPDAQQRLPSYCVAVAQIALQHAEREERRANRKKKGGRDAQQ